MRTATHLVAGVIALLALGVAAAPAAENLTRALAGADLIVGTLADKAKDRIEFIGATSFKDDELRAPISGQLQEIAAQGLTPPRADDTAYYLGAFYRKSGFAKAEVSYEIRGGKLILRIAEGARSLLKSITFTGNKAIPSEALYEYMLGSPPERLAKEPEKFPFNAGEIAAGADRVRGLYVSDGYLDAVADASQIEMTDGGSRANVTVRIVEGPRYVFGEARFAGDLIYSLDEVRGALVEQPSGPFSAAKTVTMQRNLQSYYKARGYYQAEVAVTADPQTAKGGRVPITFTATPGALYRFGETQVRNVNGRLRTDFLPRRFEHLRGKIYDPAKLDETFREMLRTGLFTNLRVNPVPKPNNTLDLQFEVEEAKAKEVGFTLGYGTYEGATAGIRLGDRNLFGRGRPLTLSADSSQRSIKGELLYVDPWFLETRFALRSRIYSVSREEEGYTKGAAGLRVDLAREVLPHLEFAAFTEAQNVKISDSTIDPLLLGPQSYLLTSIGITQSLDLRDSAMSPTRGLVLNSSFDFGMLDGEAAFTRTTLRFSYYLPLGKRYLLALGARASLISPIVDQLPIDVRFFNGGGGSVRSFAERELGPKDALGNPLGGEFSTVFNTEFIFPIWNALQGAVFVDAGNLVPADDAGLSDMRYAVGAGLRYKLPIGPLRLDYGVNPSPRADEERGAFHFSFGFAF